jgi:carbonic anhydrase
LCENHGSIPFAVRAAVKKLQNLFDNNRAWSERIRRQAPEFFSKLARQQSPD